MNLWKVYCPLCRFEKVIPFVKVCPQCNNIWLHRDLVGVQKPPPKMLSPVSEEEQLKRAKEREAKKNPKPTPKPETDEEDWWDDIYPC